MAAGKSYNFEWELDRSTKAKVLDYSLRCSQSNPIFVAIFEKKGVGVGHQIGIAGVSVYEGEAEWLEIRIDPNSRRRGIGTTLVQLMLKYLAENGIKMVYGEISSVDDVQEAINFWKKNGFQATRFTKPKGLSVAQVIKNLQRSKRKLDKVR
jgi:ribosomal protein S18 acetylase RimI-like enzyme